jgi:hypothetical protein
LLGIRSNFGNDKLAKSIFGGCPGERGRAPTEGRWLDELEEDLKALGLRGWRAREKDVNKWHRITQSKDLHCPQCQ